MRTAMAMIAATVAVVFASSARAEVINFEDLPTSGFATAVPNGYHGLNWSNFYVLRPYAFADVYGNNGYIAGMTSFGTVAYNGYGATATISSDTPFRINNMNLTSAWFSDVDSTITIKSYTPVSGAGDTFLAGRHISDQPTKLSGLNLTSGVPVYWRSITFDLGMPTGPKYKLQGKQIAFDDLDITFMPAKSATNSLRAQNAAISVPEPGTWMLIIVGCGVLGVALRRMPKPTLQLAVKPRTA